MDRQNRVKASCHPDRPHVARGLCKSCYQRQDVGQKVRHQRWCHTEAGFESQRRRRLRKEYGITLEDFNKMMELQSNVCAICEKPETRLVGGRDHGKVDSLSVDHDHGTGHIRGLLCHACNRLLCNSCDNVSLLAKAIDYLNKQLPEVSVG